MNRYKTMVLAAGLSTLLGAAGVQAQSGALKANIPFKFNAAGKTMPAGEYVLNRTGENAIFLIRNSEAKASTVVLAPVGAHYMPKQSKLVFLHSGSDYVLSEIAVAGAAQSNALTRGQVEKNMTRKLGILSMVSIPLHR